MRVEAKTPEERLPIRQKLLSVVFEAFVNSGLEFMTVDHVFAYVSTLGGWADYRRGDEKFNQYIMVEFLRDLGIPPVRILTDSFGTKHHGYYDCQIADKTRELCPVPFYEALRKRRRGRR